VLGGRRLDSVRDADGRDALVAGVLCVGRTGVSALDVQETKAVAAFRQVLARSIQGRGLLDFFDKGGNSGAGPWDVFHSVEQSGQSNDRRLVDDEKVVNDAELGQEAGELEDSVTVVDLDRRVGQQEEGMLAEAVGGGWMNLPGQRPGVKKEQKQKRRK